MYCAVVFIPLFNNEAREIRTMHHAHRIPQSRGQYRQNRQNLGLAVDQTRRLLIKQIEQALNGIRKFHEIHDAVMATLLKNKKELGLEVTGGLVVKRRDRILRIKAPVKALVNGVRVPFNVTLETTRAIAPRAA